MAITSVLLAASVLAVITVLGMQGGASSGKILDKSSDLRGVLNSANAESDIFLNVFRDDRVSKPTSSVFADDDHVVTSLHDGNVVRYALDSSYESGQSATSRSVSLIGNTGGQPNAIALHPNGRLVIADGRIGLVSMILKGKKRGGIDVLSTASAGVPFQGLRDVAVTSNGRTAYFVDDVPRSSDTVIGEGNRGKGRLIAYDFESRTTRTLLEQLADPTSLVLSGDQTFVLINEGTARRVTRMWLSGDLAGTSDVFIQDLAKPASRIRTSPEGKFLVVIPGQNSWPLNLLAGHPRLRETADQVLGWYKPNPADSAKILVYTYSGQLETSATWWLRQYFDVNEAIATKDKLLVSSPNQEGVVFMTIK